MSCKKCGRCPECGNKYNTYDGALDECYCPVCEHEW